MIELRGITFTPPDSSEHVLKDVDLTIEEGELLLVSGPTGSGKSTLLGVLAGLVPRFTGGALEGDLLLDGTSIIRTPPRERAGIIGYVGQDPVAGFVTDTVEEELAYGMEQLGLPPATMRRRVEETLDLLGIAGLRHRSLRTLSGGQQQRVAIGSVLTTHPRVVVLDEPTSALDPTAAEDVLATITRLVHDLGTSVVLAEHRLERVVPFADRIALLVGDGSLTVGEPTDILTDSPVVPPLVELGRQLGWSPLPLTVREAKRRAKGVGYPVDRVSLDLTGTETPDKSMKCLSSSGLTVTRARTPVLHDVSIELPAGRVTALMGRNGAGKSTLLWTLQGTQKRLAGSVEVAGKDPAALDPEGRRALVGLLPQTAADLLYLETVAEECDAGGPRTREILDSLVPGIPDDQHPRDLSEGQRLALALALILSADPPVVLLDEPTRGLDYAAKHALAEILRGLTVAGKAVLVATHDVEFVAEVADDVIVLADGEVVSSGDVRSVTAESPAFAPQVSKVFGPGWLAVREVVEAVRER
ncbi:energy-coupling factor transport system ATP-binding protein [Nocardioides luteus]|uniref:Cobalt ABC transporter ATP-binding protein n=1 Tax=Nocardioides luteus TaxID=1844 RepID=A0ABQ5SUA3_9ACTN|nr:ABC transporter ATP-binding protein [Nocardioides luteus]MDR7309692.1 energy-coupling factor transport system ATP-binding protein [Nocardioides luteus]GGR61959.1 cobalt ABC transporter ATP-binding protein [Nocardioides luteus]GLJ67399.1 cobalt ABC transporter ATP-binding protein [Nocardioides luteus]